MRPEYIIFWGIWLGIFLITSAWIIRGLVTAINRLAKELSKPIKIIEK